MCVAPPIYLCSEWGGESGCYFFVVFTKDGVVLGGSFYLWYTGYNYLSRYVCGTMGSTGTCMCFPAISSPAIDCMYLCVFKLVSQST